MTKILYNAKKQNKKQQYNETSIKLKQYIKVNQPQIKTQTK